MMTICLDFVINQALMQTFSYHYTENTHNIYQIKAKRKKRINFQ